MRHIVRAGGPSLGDLLLEEGVAVCVERHRHCCSLYFVLRLTGLDRLPTNHASPTVAQPREGLRWLQRKRAGDSARTGIIQIVAAPDCAEPVGSIRQDQLASLFSEPCGPIYRLSALRQRPGTVIEQGPGTMHGFYGRCFHGVTRRTSGQEAKPLSPGLGAKAWVEAARYTTP